MTKTGRSSIIRYSLLFIFLMLVAAPTPLLAQELKVEATVSENQIFAGEQFILSIEISGASMQDVSLPVLPEIPGTRLLSATPSRSSSISIINGRTTSSMSYSYTLIAREPGTHTIAPVSVEVGGTQHQTQPIQFEILDRGQLSPESGEQLPDIFLEVQLDDERPMTGQQIVASIVLYFKQGMEVTSYQPTSGWRTDGFWKEELENIRQPQAESVILSGVRYRTATLLRYALFPTRSGELSLSEYSMQIGVRTQPARNDPFGSFFGSGTNQRRVSLESAPITLTVQPLPEAPSALSLNAVGDLRVNRTLSSGEVETGGTLELITTVEGTGNIPLVRKPEYSLPDGIEQYTPQESSHIERRGLTISGSKTFSELLTPRAPGSYQIPAETVAVYHPATRSYRTIELPALHFEAVPGVAASQGLADHQPIRLQPVTGLVSWSTNSEPPFFLTYRFWIVALIPLFVAAVALRRRKITHKLQADKSFARRHFADENARKQLETAKCRVVEGDAREIYNLLHKTITRYISDKLGLPEAGLSDQDTLEALRSRNVEEETVRKTEQILDKCATISYAPAGSPSDFRSDIDKTEALIEELRSKL